MRLMMLSLALSMFICFLQTTATAYEIKGLVVKITDGDTLTLLDGANKQVKVRLAGIDTPESRQPYGNRAKQELASLSFSKRVVVKVQDVDRYARVVGRIDVGGLDVNAEMVRRGAAWVYRQYTKDPRLYALEEWARKNKKGLWGLPEAEQIPPWEWRRMKRRSK